MKAKVAEDERKIKLCQQIEDITFDYFGIIVLQYEISIKKLEADIEYQMKRMAVMKDISNMFSTE